MGLHEILSTVSAARDRAQDKYRRLTDQNIVYGNVDPLALGETGDQLTQAEVAYKTVIGRIIEVETGLCDTGVPSLPFLWTTQRRRGQALD